MKNTAVVVWALTLWAAGACGAEEPPAVHHESPADEAAEHEHRPRHGGQFGDADDIFHYELVLEPSGRLRFYVNDAHNTPLDVRTLQGRWIVNPGQPISVHGVFSPSVDGACFTAELPLAVVPEGPIPVEVGVQKDAQWVSMEFQLPRPSGPPERSAS